MAAYTVFMFVVFNLFIILHEEPRLRREFPGEYDDYITRVRRWV
jgi:protein-S-isoprenylcysteine O-methyltransferase Ste14